MDHQEKQEDNNIHHCNNNSKNVRNTFIKSARLVTGTLLKESRDEGGERLQRRKIPG